MMRKLAAGLLLALSLIAPTAAYAQVCPAVAALPDTERRVTYSPSASTGPFSIPFIILGDSTDYAQWVEVWLNGVKLTAVTQWTLTLSGGGSLATACRPITTAQITLITASTGTLEIVGARRPRRTSQFAENRGVSARDLNQVITDITAQNREAWDKVNIRALLTAPGDTIGRLPNAATRAGGVLCFDSSGNPLACAALTGLGNVVGPSVSVVGHIATFANTTGTLIQDGGLVGAGDVTGPAGATAGAITLFNGVTGKILKNGPAGTTTTVLHGNAAGDPTYSAVSLTADVTGVLPVANGGSGVATLTNHSVLLGAGTSAINPLAVPAAGTLFQGNAAADPSWTATPTLGVAGATLGTLTFAGNTSGATQLQPNATASGFLTLPAATDTLIGKATVDTLTNKTFDTAGAGNVFKINGTTVSSVTGTGSVNVMQTSPTLITPILGIATATSINKMAITAPATSSTLAVADGKTFTASNTITLTAATDGNSFAFPSGSDTVTTIAASQTLTNKTLTAPTINGGAATGLTALCARSSGTGAFDICLANTENLTAPRTLTLKVNNAARSIDISGNIIISADFNTTGGSSIALNATGVTNVTLPTTGTLVNTAVTTLANLVSVGTITTGGWQGTPVALGFGGTGQTSAAAARTSVGLNVDSVTTFGNANYTALVTDRTVATSVSFSAQRTVTLPTVASFNPGQQLVVIDSFGAINGANTLVIAANAADTINGTASITITGQFGGAVLWPIGANRWGFIATASGAGTGTMTSLSPGAGLVSSISAACSQGAVTVSGTFSTAECLNIQSGTTYAIIDGDRGKLITGSNAASQAYTIAQAGTASAFQTGWYVDVVNRGANPLGLITITPTTSLIDGASSFVLGSRQSVRLVSDGTNYQTVLRAFAASSPPQGRCTLTSGTAITTADVTGATTLYYTPAPGKYVPATIDGANFPPLPFSEMSQATSDATKSPYAMPANAVVDVWLWLDGGTLRATRGYFWSVTSTITVTIASPAVVSWTAHGLVAGQPVIFTTSGALPTGITAGTIYYVIAAGLTANAFEISATVGGAAINTSGTQSGTHTAVGASDKDRGTGAGTSEVDFTTAFPTNKNAITNGPAANRGVLACSVRSNASAQLADTDALRWVSNVYNAVPRRMQVLEATASWNYTTATFRQANAAATNQLDFLQSLPGGLVTSEVVATASNTNTGTPVIVGIDLDTLNTTAITNNLSNIMSTSLANGFTPLNSKYSGNPGIGRHILIWKEYSGAVGTTSWNGNAGGIVQSGIIGQLLN